MKKIDITVTEVDVPTNCPIVHFAVRPKMEAMMLREGEVPDQAFITAERLTYERRTVIHDLGGMNLEREDFLVKVDDNRLFDSLMKVSNDDINRLARERSEEIIQAEKARWYRQGAKEVKDHFLALPWWKRLFNKF